MPLFDVYVMVDWSAASIPKQGKDSIWIGAFARTKKAITRVSLENPSTREEATKRLCRIFAGCLERNQRVLAGFDFPFGYPSGTSKRLGITGLKWRHMWSLLSELIEDDHRNASNRFDVGARLNQTMYGEAFPFWGDGTRTARPFLKKRGRRPHGPDDVPERRLCELRMPRTQPTWKLAYTGSVGSQALTGIPRVWEIRRDPRLAMDAHIWPFETGLAVDDRVSLVLAEVYPSLVEPAPLKDKPKDAGQVVAIAKHFAALDAEDRLAPLFAGDPALSDSERDAVVSEEAWILGVTGAAA